MSKCLRRAKILKSRGHPTFFCAHGEEPNVAADVVAPCHKSMERVMLETNAILLGFFAIAVLTLGAIVLLSPRQAQVWAVARDHLKRRRVIQTRQVHE